MAKGKAVQATGVFTATDYQTLRNSRRDLADLLAKIDKAKACGVDCAVYESVRQDIDNQLAAIQQHFMTPPPQ
jgi:hypothetical protein